MTDFDSIDFFRPADPSVVENPYPYFEHLRAQCPVQRELHHDVVMVTGYEEARRVYVDTATFSSCNAVGSSRVDLQACKLEYSIVSPK